MTDLPKKLRKRKTHSRNGSHESPGCGHRLIKEPRQIIPGRPDSNALRSYYPAFLNIAGRKCVIIGGGKVAQRKCSALLAAGADVTVISPKITNGIRRYVERGQITHIGRGYKKGDLKKAFIAVSATESETINEKVARDARHSRVLLNVVDNAPLCDFIVPSVLRRGYLTIAVSTGGVSPAMAATIRRDLEDMYGREIPRYLRFLEGIRAEALFNVKDMTKRRRLLKDLASQKMLRMLGSKGFLEARTAALAVHKKLCR